MSGYRCVNYLELCRLCTASNGTKINIFSEEGKRKGLHKKIIECLPVMVCIVYLLQTNIKIKKNLLFM